MLDVMAQAKNAIEAYNEALKVSSANIANMNVPGYKKLEVSFQSVFERVLSEGQAAENGRGGTNPHQLGQGVAVASTSIDFSKGETATGTSLDLAISGSGLFIVSPDGGNTYRYTRTGNFQIDALGNLTSNGLQVYGLDNSGNVAPISGLPSGNRSDYRWQADGTLQYSADGGVTFTNTGYRIALTYFANPSGLVQSQGTTFAETLASGSPAGAQAPGGAVGSLLTGKVEQSNVFYLGETITALDIQRAMSGNLSIIKMASDLISSFIQKLG
ncbi:flagellar hook-basal body complex protein [Candidatus Saganbacteria bacterium]|uniref:Flagellar hook-basal body complex protein n=1 Tax=Candidatus Saganbacteria bacterium TaxID=2575572 RepID=A0A9D6UMG2_UNCSA|nr:flagellar hook-basal body complex protein [Candidatus Saganbacteria bacterium]